jgi:hypothetical protein
MTYTFKLSRRLALLKSSAVASLWLVLAMVACAPGENKDGFGPNEAEGEVAEIVVIPRSAVVEVNQPLQFLAYGITTGGDSVPVDMEWAATSGSITQTGLFSASQAGSVKVNGKGRGRGKALGKAKKDSTVVDVVPPPPPSMTEIAISPASVDLNTSGTQQFTAVGILSDGSTVSIGATWTATGGNVDAGGYYTAGSTVGTYHVTATHEGTQLSDVAPVNISASTPTAPTTPIPLQPAELPRVFLNTAYVAPTGATLTVAVGGDLQQALNAAQSGDVILLAPGATYTGNFTLPAKGNAATIHLQTNTTLPAEGTRVTPATAANFAKIVSPNASPALAVASGAQHYRITGVEFSGQVGIFVIVSLGSGTETTLADLAHDLVLDRVYVHGAATADVQRCVALHGTSSAVIDSYLSECHHRGADAQAVWGYNGAGPFKIVNNYLAGSGENIMFGGAAPRIPNLIPSDIEIRGNHFFKPLAWKGVWVIKNLLELKNAQRVLVEGNIFENSWRAGQGGGAILATSTNPGGAPWSRVVDITIQYNWVRNVVQGVLVYTNSWNHPVGEETARVEVRHNLLTGIGSSNGTSGGGAIFVVSSNIHSVSFEHNTGVMGAPSGVWTVHLYSGGSAPATQNLVMLNNVLQAGELSGVGGDGMNPGTATLERYATQYDYRRNLIFGPHTFSTLPYPPGNWVETSLSGFMNLAGGDYRLAGASPYRNQATDGTDIGADIATVEHATARALNGN